MRREREREKWGLGCPKHSAVLAKFCFSRRKKRSFAADHFEKKKGKGKRNEERKRDSLRTGAALEFHLSMRISWHLNQFHFSKERKIS